MNATIANDRNTDHVDLLMSKVVGVCVRRHILTAKQLRAQAVRNRRFKHASSTANLSWEVAKRSANEDQCTAERPESPGNGCPPQVSSKVPQ